MANKRLLVELTDKTDHDLCRLAGRSELNKTTIVNRAVQIYALAQELQDNGRPVGFTDDDGQWIRLVIL